MYFWTSWSLIGSVPAITGAAASVSLKFTRALGSMFAPLIPIPRLNDAQSAFRVPCCFRNALYMKRTTIRWSSVWFRNLATTVAWIYARVMVPRGTTITDGFSLGLAANRSDLKMSDLTSFGGVVRYSKDRSLYSHFVYSCKNFDLQFSCQFSFDCELCTVKSLQVIEYDFSIFEF